MIKQRFDILLQKQLLYRFLCNKSYCFLLFCKLICLVNYVRLLKINRHPICVRLCTVTQFSGVPSLRTIYSISYLLKIKPKQLMHYLLVIGPSKGIKSYRPRWISPWYCQITENKLPSGNVQHWEYCSETSGEIIKTGIKSHQVWYCLLSIPAWKAEWRVL